MTKKDVYKYHPHDSIYDIESVEDAWTLSQYIPNINTVNVFILWGENKLEPLSENEQTQIKEKILEVNPELVDSHAKINIFNGMTQLAHYLIPLFGDQLSKKSEPAKNASNIKNLYKKDQTLLSNPFVDEVGDNDKSVHTYQFGFNSKSYDMGVLAYVLTKWLDHKLPMSNEDWNDTSDFIVPATIKEISDKLIHASYPSEVNELNYRSDAGAVLSAMTKSTRFVDIRLLLGKSAKLTLGLKRYAAQAGWKILESELVKSHDGLHTISEKINTTNPDTPVTPVELLADMIGYNVLDVLNTKRLFEKDDWQIGMSQHLQLLKRFEDSFEGKLYVDSTNSKFIEYVIVPNNGGKPVRLKDSPTIDLTFPTRNGDVDMLEVARKFGLPDEAYAFYDNYRNAATTGTKKAVEVGKENVLKDPRLAKALEEGRLSDKGTTLDLWMTDTSGNVNNSHINISVGGAHGEYADFNEYSDGVDFVNKFKQEQKELSDYYDSLVSHDPILSEKENAAETRKMRLSLRDDAANGAVLANPVTGFKGTIPMSELASKINSKQLTLRKLPKVSEQPSDYVKTVFGKDVIHADVDSLYPSLLALLKTLLRLDGVDVYGELRTERLRLKKSLPEHKSAYTEQDWINNAIQLLNKLLLNSATGAADANFDTNILVSNKITAMRIIGNLLIYILSMQLASIGGTLVSINTDGLYVHGITEAEADAVIDEWKNLFQLSASPEIVPRFVSKDANNRLEASPKAIEYAGGSSFSAWKAPSLSKSVAKPAMMDEALAYYMWKQDAPLTSFDRDAVASYIKERIRTATTTEEKAKLLLQFQWILVGSASKNRYFYEYDTVADSYSQMGATSRAFIVKDSYSNTMVKLLSVAKGIAVDNPVTKTLISKDNINIKFEAGQHFITDKERRVDELIDEIKALPAKKTDIGEYYRTNKTRLDEAVEIMGVNPSAYAPLALIADFKTFTSFFKNAHKSHMTGTHSNILRSNFIAPQRLTPEMRFAINNNDLETIAATTDILENIDIDAYVDLVEGEWELWSKDHVDLWF